jgi:hypothetical protein
VLAEVAFQRLAGHVLDDLPERREPVAAVGERGARLRHHPQPPAVVLRERRDRISDLDASDDGPGVERAPAGMEQVGDIGHLG